MGAFITLYCIKALVFAFYASKKIGFVCVVLDLIMIGMVCKMAFMYHKFAEFAYNTIKVV